MLSKSLKKEGTWLIASSFFLMLSACSRQEPKASSDPQKASDSRVVASLESIQRNFVNTTCIECHTGATATNRYVSLVDISTLIEKPGTKPSGGPKARYLIKPGCPKQSLFLSIMREGKMPKSGGVPQEIIHTIDTFIKNLDPNAGKKCDEGEPPDEYLPSDEPGGK